jgi:hypothetical protein
MSEIWEKPYTNKKGQKEPQISFQYFQKYLKQPQPRNQRKLAEQIIKEQNPKTNTNTQETAKLIERKYTSIRYYSSKFDYADRVLAYDIYVAENETQELKLDSLLAKKEAVKGLKAIISDTYQKLKSGDELSDRKAKNYQNTLVGAYKGIHDILHDFVASSEVKSDVKVSKYGVLGELFSEEELEEMKEDLRNTDDIDEMIENLDDDFSEFE